MREVLLAVDAATESLTPDDQILASAFAERGVSCRAYRWGAPVPPDALVIVRSTWDYVERPEQFAAWLRELDAGGVEVHNPAAMMRWNMHKRYLVDLADRDVPIVPTVLIEWESGWSLDDVLAEEGWADAVVKPAIGASARLTIHAGRVGRVEAGRHLERILRDEDALVQPYLPSVTSDGELSIVVIAGTVTHAVVKRSIDGDFRVQSQFGGTTELVDVTAEHLAAADRVLRALDEPPTYARIDLLRDGGRLLLVEVELIEPELFFGLAPNAASLLAEVIAERGA